MDEVSDVNIKNVAGRNFNYLNIFVLTNLFPGG